MADSADRSGVGTISGVRGGPGVGGVQRPGLSGASRAGSPDSVTAGSTVVAVVLLLILGAVLTVGAARYAEPQLKDLIGSLGPLLGIITGAFVTYFFSRSAVQASAVTARASVENAKASAASADNAQSESQALTLRSRQLHNALTQIFAVLPAEQSLALRNDPVISKIFDV